jgi:hypothetical protein
VLATANLHRADPAPVALPDEQILARAASTGRALVTANIKDFVPLDARYRAASQAHAGLNLEAAVHDHRYAAASRAIPGSGFSRAWQRAAAGTAASTAPQLPSARRRRLDSSDTTMKTATAINPMMKNVLSVAKIQPMLMKTNHMARIAPRIVRRIRPMSPGYSPLQAAMPPPGIPAH